MALIPYLNRGEPVTAAHWNAFYAEIDARLAKNFSNQSILLWGDRVEFGIGIEPALYYAKKFYFFPPHSGSIWDSMAQVWYDQHADSLDPFFRRYDHNVFTDMVASLPLADPQSGHDVRPAKDDDWKVVRLAVNDLNAFSSQWAPLVWPDGVPGNYPDFATHALALSLEAHMRSVDGKEYFVYIDYSARPEYVHRFTPVEIILGDIGPAFTFPDNWNKYNVFRFHNLQARPLAVQFGSHYSLVIPPMGSKCVRRTGVNGTYTLGFNYFHTILSGDPWFYKWDGGPGLPWDGTSLQSVFGGNTDWSNITDIFCGLHVGAWLFSNTWDDSYVRQNQQYDHSKIWDVPSIYCNPGYEGGSLEVKTPAQGYFASVADETVIGDLCFHRGQLLIVNPAGLLRVSRTQAFIVSALQEPPEQFVLRKADGSVALGVQDVSVSRQGEDISALSGAELNWGIGSVLNGLSQPLYFYIYFIPRDAGSDPKLAAGDQVNVSFTHLLDDQKLLLDFDGMASLSAKLAEAGVTLTKPLPGQTIIGGAKQFQLTGASPLDIISLSCNLINGVFAVPAVTIGTGTGGSPALVFPYLWAFLPLLGLELQTDEITAQWIVWEIDGSGNYINVHWDDVTFETTSFVNVGFNQDDTFFSFYDTIGELLTHFRAKGGSLTTEAAVRMTVFGPMIDWVQSVALQYPGNGFDWDGLGYDFRLKLVANKWVLERRGIAPLRGTPGSSTIPPQPGTANFGWPNFRPYPQWGVDSSLPALYPVDVATCFPRFERFWQNYRFFSHDPSKEPFAWPGAEGGVTSEHPLVKSFYESKPFDDATLLPVAKAPAHAKTGISFLGPFPQGYDILTRLSAWVNFSVLTFQSPSGPQVYNFNKGQPWQSAYYTSTIRQHVLSNSPVAEDGAGLARNALPMQVEHYNAAASAMNVITGTPGGGAFFSETAYALFNQCGLRPGRGLGYRNFRPRDQWVSWDDHDNPEITQWMLDRGVTIRTGADLPSSLWDYVNTLQLWAVWDAQTGGPTLTETIQGLNGPQTVFMQDTGWGDYLFGSTQYDPSLNGGAGGYRTPTVDELKTRLNNFRWLSIEDAKALYQILGIPFGFEEVVVPCKLVVKDAQWTALDSRGGNGTGGQVLSRAVGFVNDESGDWVIDNDAGNAIRADIGQVDYCLFAISWSGNDHIPGAQVLYDAEFGELQQRFYPDDGPPVPATQLIRANKYYLWRSYGGPNARCVVFPRNYADYERNWDNSLVRYFAPGGFSHIPRRAITDLEGQDPEVTDLRSSRNLLNPDEVILTTDFENAVFSIYSYGIPF